MTPLHARWGLLPVVLLTGACSVVGYPAPGPEPVPAVGTPAPDEAPPGATSVGEASEAVRDAAESPSASSYAASYRVFGQVYYVLPSADGYDEEGWASWYGEEFAGRPTSSGEIYEPDGMSAAHRSLPLPTWVEVTNLENGRRVVLRVNDRGPFVDPERRIIDVSRGAARRLGLIGPGVARVRVRALSAEELAGARPPGPLGGGR